MAKTEINCLNCDVKVLVDNREINRGNGKFCTHKCSSEYRSKNKIILEPNVECAYCFKKFYKNTCKRKLSKSGLYFCCREHKDMAQKLGGIKEIMPPHFGTAAIEDCRVYRRIAFSEKEQKCERCGYDENPFAIIIHHKDRNRKNGDIENLEVLCCNCHAIEHFTSGKPRRKTNYSDS